MSVILAGVLAFLSPCILPLLPFALCHLGALALTGASGGTATAGKRRRGILPLAGAFSLGLALVFLRIGAAASGYGSFVLAGQPVLVWVAVLWLGVAGIGLAGPRHVPASLAGKGAALASGLAFGIGLVPCVGPALAAILRQLAQGDAAAQLGGLAALVVYAAAMVAPFILIAALLSAATAKLVGTAQGALRLRRVLALGTLAYAALLAGDRISMIGEWLIGLSDWSWVLV